MISCKSHCLLFRSPIWNCCNFCCSTYISSVHIDCTVGICLPFIKHFLCWLYWFIQPFICHKISYTLTVCSCITLRNVSTSNLFAFVQLLLYKFDFGIHYFFFCWFWGSLLCYLVIVLSSYMASFTDTVRMKCYMPPFGFDHSITILTFYWSFIPHSLFSILVQNSNSKNETHLRIFAFHTYPVFCQTTLGSLPITIITFEYNSIWVSPAAFDMLRQWWPWFASIVIAVGTNYCLNKKTQTIPLVFAVASSSSISFISICFASRILQYSSFNSFSSMNYTH